MELRRAFDDPNGGVETQNGALDGLETSGRRFANFDKEQDPDPESEKPDPDPDLQAWFYYFIIK